MNSSRIILTNSSDWRPWLFVIKSMAVSGGVCKYINPNLETQIPEPVLSIAPSPAEASSVAGHMNFATLTADEREIFKLLYNEYKESLSLARQEMESLKTIRNQLVTSVSKDNIVYIETKDTIYEMLVALKKRLAPTDEARKLEIIDKYHRLQHFDQKTDVEEWCRE